MERKIVTKFTVATDAGVDALLYLTETIARQKFAGLVSSEILDRYISGHYNEKHLTTELNDILSNQWLVVFVNDEPAGYARITSQGKIPYFPGKSSIRIAEFGILGLHNHAAVWSSLFEKCYNISKSYEVVWLHEYLGNPAVDYFEKQGFVRLDQEAGDFELPIESVLLAKENS